MFMALGALIAFMLHAIGQPPPAKIIVVPVMVYQRGALVPDDPETGARELPGAQDCCEWGRNA